MLLKINQNLSVSNQQKYSFFKYLLKMSDVTPMKTRTEPTPYSISPTTCKPSYLHIDNRYPPLNLQIVFYLVDIS